MRRLLVIPVLFLFSCTTFMKDKEVPILKEYENQTYVLKREIKIQDKFIPKGEKVKILVKVGTDWVRIHAYSATGDQLKVQRFLALLMIDEDFPEKIFDKALFDKRFNEIFDPVKDAKKSEIKK